MAIRGNFVLEYAGITAGSFRGPLPMPLPLPLPLQAAVLLVGCARADGYAKQWDQLKR